MSFISINVSTTAVSLFFIILLIGIYLTKKNANNFDNKIFRHLLFWNFLSLLLHLIYQILALDYLKYSSVIGILILIYFCCVIYYVVLLTIYIVYSTNENNKKFLDFININEKKVNIIIYSSYVIFFILALITPSRVSFQEEAIYYYGLGGYFYYVTLGISIIIAFTSIIKNRGNFDKKKIYPLYIILALSVVYTIAGLIYPGICLLTTLFAGYSFLMFHTMANPDMKLISELELAKNSAEKANNAKSDFLSSMSHELRTPLNAILGFSNVIKDSSDIDNIHSDIDEVINSSNKLLDMVDSILNVNQLDNNNLEIVNNKYNITDIVLNINDNIDYRIKEKNLTYTFNISNNVPRTLFGDSNKIKTIITNLLSNAVKYTDEGAINLDINCLNNKDDCNLTITVSDTGRGINDAQRESLFEKFNRLEEDRDSDIEGTGLGLNITKSLVDLLEGDISVSSIPGEGSTFTVKLKQKIFNEEIII